LDSIWRLRAFLKPYRKHMLVVIAATVGVTALNLVGPWMIREVLHILRVQESDGFIRSGVMGQILLYTAVFAGAHVLRGVFQFLVSYVSHVMAWSFVSDLRVALYQHLQKLSLRFYHDKQTGEIMSRLVNTTRANYMNP